MSSQQTTLELSDDGKRLSFTKQPAQRTTPFTIDDFQDLVKIGSGKFGKVYLASEKQSGIQVAIKQVYKELLNQYDFFSQMKKELEIQYRLGIHPNIAKLHCYFHDEKSVYSIIEYAKEVNLYQKLKKTKYFEEPIARKIIQQVISALWFL